MRAEQGAGPVTLGIDIGVIKMIITHAAAACSLNIRQKRVIVQAIMQTQDTLFGLSNPQHIDFVS
jgi:hypothetical protein